MWPPVAEGHSHPGEDGVAAAGEGLVGAGAWLLTLCPHLGGSGLGCQLSGLIPVTYLLQQGSFKVPQPSQMLS